MSRPWKTITRRVWRQMLVVGHELDLERGGLYDARAGCVNFWASPEDHPTPSWDRVEIPKGALTYPRAFVGTVAPDPVRLHREDRVPLVIDCSPYERVEDDMCRTRYGVGFWEAIRQGRHFQFKTDVRDDEVTQDEWAWIEQKAQALLDIAS